jgi:uncharacterized protein (DUF885 family)
MQLAKKSISPLPLYFKVMMEIRENIREFQKFVMTASRRGYYEKGPG